MCFRRTIGTWYGYAASHLPSPAFTHLPFCLFIQDVNNAQGVPAEELLGTLLGRSTDVVVASEEDVPVFERKQSTHELPPLTAEDLRYQPGDDSVRGDTLE